VDPYPRTWAEIDLDALRHNLLALKGEIGLGVRLALVAKADAYGHGLVPVARMAARTGVDFIAVATVSEGIALRDAGIENHIIILSPILAVEADQAVFYDFDITVESRRIAESISASAASQGRTARIHLKVDTGLHRFGCRPDEAVALAQTILALPGLQLVGISQHFADSSYDDAGSRRLLETFDHVMADMHEAGISFDIVHAANSAATVKWPNARGTMVRVGILAYGIDPLHLMQGRLRQVMTLQSRVTAERWIDPGEKVGYNSTWTAERPSRVLTIGAGYGDGYPRTLSNKGIVALRGHECPVIGMVCMDQLMIDATDIPEAGLGDVAILIGYPVTADRLAALAGTNSHEIVTRLMSRVPRRYLYPD
jgi:alanine racemase